MFISKLLLNPRNRGAFVDFSDSYSLYQTLLRAYLPGDPKLNSGRLLFRAELPERSSAVEGLTVIVQNTDKEPQWQEMKETGYLMDYRVKEVNFESIPKGIYYFRLYANPTIQKQGRRIGLYKEEEQEGWLRRKAELSGMKIASFNAASYISELKPAAKEQAGKAKIHHLGVRYDGVLAVTRPQAAAEAVINGIGSAKSFGFGLLSLKRKDE